MTRKKKIPTRNEIGDEGVNQFHDEQVIKKPKRRNVTQKIDFKISVSSDEHCYRLGCFTIQLQNTDDCVISDEFNVVLKPCTQDCDIVWNEKNENEEILEKYCTGTINNIPYDVLHGLIVLRSFIFVISSSALSSPENLVVKVHLNPSTFISLKVASEPCMNKNKKIMYKILHFFLNIEFEVYEENYLLDKEQIMKMYDSFSNCYDPNVRYSLVSHEYLLPELRMYQSQAVHWMLKREQDSTCNSNLHVLYTSITFEDGSEAIFHKYGGFFVKEKFTSEISVKGGILADEMGLGKTLEVLACILLNPRITLAEELNEVPHADVINGISDDNLSPEVTRKRKQLFSENADEYTKKKSLKYLHLDEDLHFECVCGSPELDDFSVQCKSCGICQHIACIWDSYEEVLEDEYKCPYCWLSNTVPIKSQATLIVCPSSIIQQWKDEILRHIKKQSLKLFLYEGVEYKKFVDPNVLADQHIVLTSYETLRNELYLIDLSQGSARRVLRNPKKFMTIPSPLAAIEWWRICLDEAQMVESVMSKIAKTTAKLHSINRWCVTGTPIQKSVEDFYGLFSFLGVRPYHEKLWWREVLWKPFVNGNASYLTSALNEVVWRTCKNKVMDQIGLPALQVIPVQLNFFPVEKLFYEKQYGSCRSDLVQNLMKYDIFGSSEKLNSFDKSIVSRILLPLKRLQQLCCHYQITFGTVIDVAKNKMSTSELLLHLLKKTKYECEEAHRKHIMALNGLAGLYSAKKDFKSAADIYVEALNLIEERKPHVRTDVTQQIHTSFHLSNAIINNSDGEVNEKFPLPTLYKNIEELTSTYIDRQKSAINASKSNVDEINEEISETLSKFKMKKAGFYTSTWWAHIYETMSENDLQKLLPKLNSINFRFGDVLQPRELPFWGEKQYFLKKIYDESSELYEARLKLKGKMDSISSEPSVAVIDSVTLCHLRPPEDQRSRVKCIYCKAEDVFYEYEAKLFDYNDHDGPSASDDEKTQFRKTHKGTQRESKLETMLKMLVSFSQHRKSLNLCNEDGRNELKLIDFMRKEFKLLRQLWLKCSEYASIKDEIEMAKISMRILLPEEKPPSQPVPYIIPVYEINNRNLQYRSEVISFNNTFKKKLGQLFYLQNLEKAENKDAPFSENCPVCQQVFENTWCVLRCGHCFCVLCAQKLLTKAEFIVSNLGFPQRGMRCPVCREPTPKSDVYCIDNKVDDDVFPVEGSHCAKVHGVLKCLLQINQSNPEAKSVIFSTFVSFLIVLEMALQENKLEFVSLRDKKKFHKQLGLFKESKSINILLSPLKLGCNGLNIIEATHILLVEPVIDESKHQQAIGRAHRMGQTRTVIVYRFYISKTIEDGIFNMNLSQESKGSSALTVNDLENIFKYNHQEYNYDGPNILSS